MYTRISSNKYVISNLKFTFGLLLLLSTSIFTPLLVNLVQTEKTLDHIKKYNIPMLKPFVEFSAPEGFKPNSVVDSSFDFTFENELKQRFFVGYGPTSIYTILDQLDQITDSLNLLSRETYRTCLDIDPVAVPLGGWPMENKLEVWIQCFEKLGTPDNFLMFGKKDDMIYIYERTKDTTMVAFVDIVSTEPGEGYPCCYQVNGGGDACVCDLSSESCYLKDTNITDDGNCRTIPNAWPVPQVKTQNKTNSTLDTQLSDVNIYISVGTSVLPTESGPRGLIHIEAKPKANFIQASLAGIGMGFCGVQFASDGERILVKGSMEGPGGTCLQVNQTCSSSTLVDHLNTEECTNNLGFSIAPMGRIHSPDFKGLGTFEEWAPSNFPGGNMNNVVVDNTPTSNIVFGPPSVPPHFGVKMNFNTKK